MTKLLNAGIIAVGLLLWALGNIPGWEPLAEAGLAVMGLGVLLL